MLKSILMALAATAVTASAALADQPTAPSTCAMPVGLAGWSKRSPLTGVAKLSETVNARVTAGAGVDATLLATPRERKNEKTGKIEKSTSYGGLFAFTVDQEGVYRVALGSKARVDILHDGETLDSISHDHGPACSGVAKMVDFKLTAGDHIVMITQGEVAVIPMLIGRLP